MRFDLLKKTAALTLTLAFTVIPLFSCGDDGVGDGTDTSADTTEYIYVPESTTSDGVLTKDQVGEGQHFLNSFAKVGVELVLTGYPEGTKFSYKIEHMRNGKTEEFENDTGRYTPTENDLESMITVSANGFDDISIYCSELPVLYFTSKTKYRAITKNDYADAYMTMQGNSEIQSGLFEGTVEIKVRGNSTAGLDKRPFKIKLSKKENMLELGDGKSKHWVLLANAIDHTLVRNKLLYDFSGAIGTEVYMKSENVVLIYNGEYYGVYQLCEHLRVDSDRVDVYDWEGAAEDAAEALAKKLRDDGAIKAEEVDSEADKIEDKLMSDFSWIDSGEFKYNSKKYTFEDLGITLPATTGGYLVEMDFYSRGNNTIPRLESAYRQPLYITSIETDNPKRTESLMNTSLYKNAYTYMQSFEYALHSDDFFYRENDLRYEATGDYDWSIWWGGKGADAADKYGYAYNESNYSDAEHDGWHYSDFFDMDSLVNNFIFCEFAMNWDSMKNSFFYYKDIDGKAKIGPQWDFDWAWGNKNMYNINTYYPKSWHTTEDDFTVEQYYQKVQWNRMLIRDPYFLALAYDKWHEIRGTVIEDMIKEGGLIDQYYEKYKTAAIANDTKWKKTYKSYGGEEYDDAVDSMYDFIIERVTWLDDQFRSFSKFAKSLGYYHKSKNISVEDVTLHNDGTATVTANVKEGSKIKSVVFQINGTKLLEADVSGGVATVTFKTEDYLTNEHKNCVEVKAKNARGEYMYDSENSSSGAYNQVVGNYKVFDIK